MADTVLSVGVDIGTSTTQVLFSTIVMDDTSGYFSVPRVTIVDKRVVYRGRVHTTPLLSDFLLDGDGVEAIVEAEFRRAGYRPTDTGTGAVIITGESARKDNAATVLHKLSRFAGEFVVSTAGPDLESVMAGKGSGAWQYSIDNGCAAVNLDIGGGTTNGVLFHCGEVLSVGCLDIGGRLIRLDRDGTVIHVSPAAAKVAAHRGASILPGCAVPVEALEAVCQEMALVLESWLGLSPPHPLLEEIATPGSSALSISRPIDALFLSGGVADSVYRQPRERFPYGDIGALLGEAIRRGRLASALPLKQPAETIRATVVGAGTCTLSLSGSTIFHTGDALPLKNLPVLRLGRPLQESCFAGDASPLLERLDWFRRQSGNDCPAIALEGLRSPTYRQIQQAAAVFSRAGEQLSPGAPLVIALRWDMAKALGQSIHRLTPERPLIVIDSVQAGENDYLDLGRPLLNGLALPVVIKTLVFG